MQKVHNNVPTKQGCVQIGAVGIYIDVLDDFYLEVGRTNVYFKVEEELEEQGQTVNNTQGGSFMGHGSHKSCWFTPSVHFGKCSADTKWQRQKHRWMQHMQGKT